MSFAAILQKTMNLTPKEYEQLQLKAEANRLLKEKAQKDKKSGGIPPVGPSGDFQRIKKLSFREWNKFQQDDYIDVVTDTLRTPDGTMRLRPVQAAALIEAQRANGLLALMGVGSGKALVSFLLPQVLNSQKCVLLVPPSLVEQTKRVFVAMSQHWQLNPSGFHIVSYSTLSSPINGDIVEKLKPDLIVADEAHKLKNKTAACTKRVMRYLAANPDCKFCALSGTLTTRSLKDYQHLAVRALGPNSPLPMHWPTLAEWCQAIDADVPLNARRPPGVLREFCEKPEENVREGFQRRLISTMGVVATDQSMIGTSLVFNKRPLTLSPKIEEAMKSLNKDWATPDGKEFSDVLELASTARELSCGFWYKWIWPKDKNGEEIIDTEWLEARKNWNRAVRERLQHGGPGMDSPLLLFNAAKAGRWECPEFEPWYRVKDRPEPESVAQWVDDEFMILDAIRWAMEVDQGRGSIIWYTHDAVGKKLQEKSGFSLYGAGKKAAMEILDATGKKPIIVSMNAHREGKNLQDRFWRNLITTPPASGQIFEQAVGRCHREGQKEDEVVVDMYLHTDVFMNSFRKSYADAKYMQETTKNVQKLILGTKTFEGYE